MTAKRPIPLHRVNVPLEPSEVALIDRARNGEARQAWMRKIVVEAARKQLDT
jgi:hypothetical protein